MPLVLLVLFITILGSYPISIAGHRVSQTTYYLANETCLGIVNATLMALVVAIVAERESGILKRRRLTPEPLWVLLTGRALATSVSSLAVTALLLVVGCGVYGVGLPVAAVASLAVTVVLGTLVFTAIGFALANAVPTATAAQPTGIAVVMPLFFISGVFIPWPYIPHWLQEVAGAFPVRPLANAILVSSTLKTPGAGSPHGTSSCWSCGERVASSSLSDSSTGHLRRGVAAAVACQRRPTSGVDNPTIGWLWWCPMRDSRTTRERQPRLRTMARGTDHPPTGASSALLSMAWPSGVVSTSTATPRRGAMISSMSP